METNGPWRDTLKRLLGTPPAMGVEVISSPIQKIINETENFIRAKIAVVCDPDALEQTARKNAELMANLRDINDKLERGELVEVVRCKNCIHYISPDRGYPYCSIMSNPGEGEYYTTCDDHYCSCGERR